MTLIRHNERTGSNQPVHYAHDTEQPDTTGCYVPGRTDKVFTSQGRPCPKCGGYGKLVAIKKLSRDTYPAGQEVPGSYRVVTGGTRTVEPVEPSTVVEPTPYVPRVERLEPPAATATATAAPTDDAANAISALLATLVPDAGKIRADIAKATEDLRIDMATDTKRTITEAIEALIVPTVVDVRREGRETVRVEGAHAAFTECLAWLNSGRHIWLVGPAGCGKTTLAKDLATALGVPFYTTGQVLSEHQVTGFVDAGGNYHTTPFREAFEHGGLWLGDEMDSWSPEAALAANAALANGHASFPDNPTPVEASPDFYVVAAANTFGHGADREYVGRNEMDAATLDRFVTVPVDYDKALETTLAGQYVAWRDLVWKVRANVEAHHIRKVVGTRSIVFGVEALASGMDQDLVTKRLLQGDSTDSEWARVSA